MEKAPGNRNPLRKQVLIRLRPKNINPLKNSKEQGISQVWFHMGLFEGDEKTRAAFTAEEGFVSCDKASQPQKTYGSSQKKKWLPKAVE